MQDASSIRQHCAELERCNQRGDRMLSILDLLDSASLSLDLAAYLTAKVLNGASFMVGASPGGAGKTTVMCALLNMTPASELIAATPDVVRRAARDEAPLTGDMEGNASRRRCYVCHEVGSGPYFAYLWGRDLRDYCSLVDKGHILATNLHADDMEEARDQLCEENDVPLPHFNAFDLLVFLRVKGGHFNTRRIIDKVYVSDGEHAHTLAYDASSRVFDRNDVDDAQWIRCREFLDGMFEANVRTIQETRHHILAAFG